jgi:hypothetical protein
MLYFKLEEQKSKHFFVNFSFNNTNKSKDAAVQRMNQCFKSCNIYKVTHIMSTPTCLEYNKFTHMYVHLLVLFLIMNHQCMIMNHLQMPTYCDHLTYLTLDETEHKKDCKQILF